MDGDGILRSWKQFNLTVWTQDELQAIHAMHLSTYKAYGVCV